MVRIRLLMALLVLALGLPAASAASAASHAGATNAPPGNSAIDEYLETVPGATGNGSPRQPGQGGDTLSRAQLRQLDREGRDGKALAHVVEVTSPPRSGSRRANAEVEQAAGIVESAESRSPLGAALAAATGEGDGGMGMGLLLPVVLIASAAAIVGFRRRA